MDFDVALGRILLAQEKANTFSGVVRITRDEQELFAGAYGYANRSWGMRNHLGVREDYADLWQERPSSLPRTHASFPNTPGFVPKT